MLSSCFASFRGDFSLLFAAPQFRQSTVSTRNNFHQEFLLQCALQKQQTNCCRIAYAKRAWLANSAQISFECRANKLQVCLQRQLFGKSGAPARGVRDERFVAATKPKSDSKNNIQAQIQSKQIATFVRAFCLLETCARNKQTQIAICISNVSSRNFCSFR